jgi:hypothetical protein
MLRRALLAAGVVATAGAAWLALPIRIGMAAGGGITVCTKAPNMKKSVGEARSLLLGYVATKQPVSLWSLMTLADIVPLSVDDELHLGHRRPFTPVAGPNGVTLTSAMQAGDDCPITSPGCSEATFPLLFQGKTGTARASFGRTIAASISGTDPLTVDLGDGVPVHMDKVPLLPANVVLKTIQLGSSQLRYALELPDTHRRVAVVLQTEGNCTSQ